MTLATFGGSPALSHPIVYRWPKVTEESERLVLNQLHSGQLSIYDRSGVVAQFEEAFRQYHDARFALITSSGTAALHSAYYAVGLGPGDEVLCPTYTFFATAMPLFQLGALPVLVDCRTDGTFDAALAEDLITERTRAIVVTHMWGLPCDMNQITQLCAKYNIVLIEDCSHAHGATWGSQPVGTFGEAAAWSLQTQKIIAAGEGGILVTNSREVYDKAQLLGHFNKRAIQEMDRFNPYYRYAATGLGLKYRAHPLGIAFALGQLPMLRQWIACKQEAASRITSIMSALPGVIPLNMSDKNRTSAYYALVFRVDQEQSGVSRDLLVDAIHAEGFHDIDIPKATSPLHGLTAFTDPISPVFQYDRPSLRAPSYPLADRIAANSFKVSVPCEGVDDEDENRFISALGVVVGKIAFEWSTLGGRGL